MRKIFGIGVIIIISYKICTYGSGWFTEYINFIEGKKNIYIPKIISVPPRADIIDIWNLIFIFRIYLNI